MSQNSPKDWRELCRKAQEELDPDKLIDLIVEINKALDDQALKRKGTLDKISDLDTETESCPLDLNFPTRCLLRRSPLIVLRSFAFPEWLKSA